MIVGRALRLLFAWRASFLLTILLLALVAAYAIGGFAVMRAFRADIVVRSTAATGHLSAALFDPATHDLVDRIERVPFVALAAAGRDAPVVLTSPRGAAAVQARSVEAAQYALWADEFATSPIAEGALRPGGLAVGSALAFDLNLTLGDRVEISSRVSGAPQSRFAAVTAIFAIAPQLDRDLVFVASDVMAAIAPDGSAAPTLRVWLTEPDAVQESGPQLRALLLGLGRVVDWRETAAPMARALDAERAVSLQIALLVLALALLVSVAAALRVAIFPPVGSDAPRPDP